MVSARLRRVRIIVAYRGPQDRGPLPRLHLEVESAERGLTPLLDVVEVHEEGVHAHTLRAPRRRVLVVVLLVELALVVSDDLHELAVGHGHARQVRHALLHTLEQRILKNLGEVGPTLRARPHRRDLVACQGALESLLAQLDDALRLLLLDEVVEAHDPRLSAEHLRRVLWKIRDRALERGLDVTRQYGRLAPSLARRPVRAAHAAALAAVAQHEFRIFRALPGQSPRLAISLVILTLPLNLGRRLAVLAQPTRLRALHDHELGILLALAEVGPLFTRRRVVRTGTAPFVSACGPRWRRRLAWLTCSRGGAGLAARPA
mmetsp:Transcript_16841/g.43569  ORF Transcript_16841/g.43569 Transcript_16841/m.43569 type:complete len:318 (-) Transcript_16841:81-1034(-)